MNHPTRNTPTNLLRATDLAGTPLDLEARRANPVEHPPHYTSHPSGVECIVITEHLPFCIGNAVKYLWRAGEKGDPIEDLRKAAWYVNREIARLGGTP